MIGSVFEGTFRRAERDGVEGVLPTIRGRAFVTAEGALRFDPGDPFVHGIRA